MSAPGAPRDETQRLVVRPAGPDVLILAVAVLGVSAAAPLIAAIAAPALAIALWRNVFGVVVLWPIVLLRRRTELRTLRRRGLGLTVAAGLALAAHFGTWVPAVTMTSVASATALVAMQPVWNAVLARFAGQDVPWRAWLGIGIALAGVLLLTGVDVTVSRRALLGDLLALIGGVFGAVYVALGSAARRGLSATTYSTICYSVCAVVLFLACLIGGVALFGYPPEAWWMLVALTVSAQLLGHTLFNRALANVGPLLVSLLILVEVPAAAVIAAAWLGQVPPLAVIPAAIAILAGVAIVITVRPPTTAPPD
jgi:drug/metabolite transporter (DMT)-like permease